jgi:hypothetical protein
MKQSKSSETNYAKSAVARIRIPLEEQKRAFQLIQYEDHSFDNYQEFAAKYHELKAKGIKFEVNEVCCHICTRMNEYGIRRLLALANKSGVTSP